MTLCQAAEQARLFEHDDELTLAVPTQLLSECGIRKCIVCDGLIDVHPGRGRKPLTCGKVQCKLAKHRINYWRRKNEMSKALLVAKLIREGSMPAPQAPTGMCPVCGRSDERVCGRTDEAA